MSLVFPFHCKSAVQKVVAPKSMTQLMGFFCANIFIFWSLLDYFHTARCEIRVPLIFQMEFSFYELLHHEQVTMLLMSSTAT